MNPTTSAAQPGYHFHLDQDKLTVGIRLPDGQGQPATLTPAMKQKLKQIADALGVDAMVQRSQEGGDIVDKFLIEGERKNLTKAMAALSVSFHEGERHAAQQG